LVFKERQRDRWKGIDGEKRDGGSERTSVEYTLMLRQRGKWTENKVKEMEEEGLRENEGYQGGMRPF